MINMKIFYLILSKIKNMVKTNPFIFTILCIGIFSCNLMFIYTYGILIQANISSGIPDYYIYYRSGERIGVFDIEKQLKEYSVSIDYYLPLNIQECSFDTNNKRDITQYLIRARKDSSFFYTIKGKVSNLEELNSVLVPADFTDLNIGDIIMLNGSNCKIVGTTVTPFFIVSIATFEEIWHFPDVIAIDIARESSNKFSQILFSIFGHKYRIEQIETPFLADNDKFMLVIVAIIYILCVASLLFLMTYIYQQSAYELNIYEIFGATRRVIISIFAIEMLIIISVVNLVSQLFHGIFYKSLFSKLNFIDKFEYTLHDYMITFGFTLFLVYVFVLIYILVRTRKSVIKNAGKFIE